jgi:hypothetical protein
MESFRLPRFRRVLPVAPLKLTERDRNLIRLVHRHRFLRSQQIIALFAHSSQLVIRRLQLLYHHGYLERPRAQLDYYHLPGSRHIVYGLGSKGGKLLKKELGSQFPLVRWGEKNRSVGRIFLEHALLVSEIMVAIERACRQTGIRFISEEELSRSIAPDGKPTRFRWNTSIAGNRKLGIVPDCVFALEYPGNDGASIRAYFFLEADRGTMPITRRTLTQTSFFRKILAYEATWAQSLHHTKFGFHRFRVLTVTKSPERVQSLVNACADLKRGHGLFLFADQSILSEPDLLFASKWQTGRGHFDSLIDPSCQ